MRPACCSLQCIRWTAGSDINAPSATAGDGSQLSGCDSTKESRLSAQRETRQVASTQSSYNTQRALISSPIRTGSIAAGEADGVAQS